MKNLKFVLLLLIVSTALINLYASTNYEIYTIDNSRTYCLSPDENSIYVIEKIKKIETIVKRELSSGTIQKIYDIELPWDEIGNIAISKTEATLYVATNKIVEGSTFPQLDNIYSIKLKSGKTKSLIKELPEISFLTTFVKVDKQLLLSSMKGDSYLLNIKKSSLKEIIADEEYRMIFAAVQENGAVFGKMSDNELIDIYFCDFEKKFKLTPAGKYQPDLRISSNEEDNKSPYFILDDDKYSWIADSYNKNRYPSPVMMLADNKLVMDNYPTLNKYYEISTISLIQDTWIIGNKYNNNSIVVFNIVEPKLTKTPTVNEEDMAGINKFFDDRTDIVGSPLTIPNIDQIFSAKFYNIDLVTTNSEYTSTSSLLAYEIEGNYAVLIEKEMLLSCLNPEFRLNENTALLFEEVLDVLYPLGVFEIDDKDNYQKDNSWFFIRDESFGEFSGIIVDFDEEGKIISIKEESNIK